MQFTREELNPWGDPYAWHWGPYRYREDAERDAVRGRELHPTAKVEVKG